MQYTDEADYIAFNGKSQPVFSHPDPEVVAASLEFLQTRYVSEMPGSLDYQQYPGNGVFGPLISDLQEVLLEA